MVALQLYIIQQRVSLVCAKFRICSFIEILLNSEVLEMNYNTQNAKIASITEKL